MSKSSRNTEHSSSEYGYSLILSGTHMVPDRISGL